MKKFLVPDGFKIKELPKEIIHEVFEDKFTRNNLIVYGVSCDYFPSFVFDVSKE